MEFPRILAVLIVFGFWSGSVQAAPLEEQNTNVDQCWCVPCGKSIPCGSQQDEPVMSQAENRPAKGNSKDAEKAVSGDTR